MNKKIFHILAVDDDDRIRELVKEYLIEKDAGIHESKEETTIECLPSGDCYDPNWEPVYEEESTNEQNNETSAIVPTIHAS